MFSTAQQAYCDSLIPTMYARGYPYYIAYTYSIPSSGWNQQSVPDLYIVFSKDPITSSNGYSYSVPSDSVRYAIRTNNYSTSSGANNSERMAVSNFYGNLTVDPYEHIYSNATFTGSTIQPDILDKGGKQNEYLQAQGFMLTAFFLFVVFWKICTVRR